MEIMKRMPQLDIQDRYKDNLHREEPENMVYTIIILSQ